MCPLFLYSLRSPGSLAWSYIPHTSAAIPMPKATLRNPMRFCPFSLRINWAIYPVLWASLWLPYSTVHSGRWLISYSMCVYANIIYIHISSMMVSNLNSLATVCWEDFVSQLPKFKGLSDKQQLRIIKIVTVICGLIIMCVAFGVGLLSGVIESSLLVFSATSGPLLGCFILAMMVPVANWKGTSAGMITACAFVLWIIGGSMTVDKPSTMLPTSTEVRRPIPLE